MGKNNIADASPTKGLFIDMLIKDIPLIRAIIDLVDNSVDGARRLRSNKSFSGLWIRIEVTPDLFKISDNCGGIPIELARDYAFRFGRPDDMEPTPHSVGQFGVGMKRAIFKLGKKFKIESRTEESYFEIEEDVDDWKRSDKWEFKFDEMEEGANFGPDQTGTTVEVKELHETVKDNFKLDRFIQNLERELSTAHVLSMDNGLAISINQIPLNIKPLNFLRSTDLTPAYKELKIEVGKKDDKPEIKSVDVKIYVGLSDSDPNKAGWYIFCNGRMILEHDQTETTGWSGGSKIPKFHNQYARFRGLVFFDSDDAGELPWNTTKTGVDEDSPIYQHVRLKMIDMMRPIIKFLNDLKAEKSEADDSDLEGTPLETVLSSAEEVKYVEVEKSDKFSAKKPPKKTETQKVNRIMYYKPVDKVQRVQKELGAKNFKEVGERTFDYFFNMECED